MSVGAHRIRPGRDDLIQWRKRILVTAGFDDDLATRLARERDVDLHALLELVDRDCSPILAARILGPLRAAPW